MSTLNQIADQLGSKLNIKSPPSDKETIQSQPSDEETEEKEFSFSFDLPSVNTLLMESPAGPIFQFAGKVTRDSPETCEKSRSTGFSNMWRFREMGHRSNSDGRDAFVFMNRGSEKREKAKSRGKKGNKKGKNAAYLEHYVESRERREKDKMRTYLPYKHGFFGVFTSLSGGGLSKNIHPY